MRLRFYKVSANSDKECLVTCAEFLATRQHVKKLGPITRIGSFYDVQDTTVNISSCSTGKKRTAFLWLSTVEQ